MAHSIGFLGPDVVAAHCVHMSEKDIEIMRSRGVKISHCPASNMKLASGISPVWRMINEGICAGLGTDGSCSNNRIDMFQEMKIASLLQKVSTGDPSALPAKTVLESATVRGAEALGLNCGSIEAGRDADIVLVNLKAVNLAPGNNLYSHIVYSAVPENVDTVICAGRILMRGRKILPFDEEKILERAEEAKERLTTE